MQLYSSLCGTLQVSPSHSVSVSLQTGGRGGALVLLCISWWEGLSLLFTAERWEGLGTADSVCLLATLCIWLKLAGIFPRYGYFPSLLFIDCLQFPQLKNTHPLYF